MHANMDFLSFIIIFTFMEKDGSSCMSTSPPKTSKTDKVTDAVPPLISNISPQGSATESGLPNLNVSNNAHNNHDVQPQIDPVFGERSKPQGKISVLLISCTR